MDLKLRREYGRLEEYVYENVSYKGDIVVAPRLKCTGGELKTDELPSVTRDRIFKRMFGMESTKKYACMLFASIFEIENLPEFTKRMNLYTNEIPSRMVDGREVRLDFVGACEGTYFSLEMNNSNKLERNADYASRLYALNMKRGHKDGDTKYNTVVQFNINNFTVLGVNKPVNISVSIGDGVRRTKIIYVDIYLPRIAAKYKCGGSEKLNRAERLILTMFATSRKEAIKLAEGNEEMMKFIEKLENLKRKKTIMKDYYKDDDLFDAGVGLGREEGREEGLAEGLEVGREENRVETATTMLKDGISPEVVQKYTKLPLNKINQIMTLL